MIVKYYVREILISVVEALAITIRNVQVLVMCMW